MKNINIDLKLFSRVTIACANVTITQLMPVFSDFNIKDGFYEYEESIDELTEITWVNIVIQENLHLLEGDKLGKFILRCKTIFAENNPKFKTEESVCLEFFL